jgi:hypothetical protein
VIYAPEHHAHEVYNCYINAALCVSDYVLEIEVTSEGMDAVQYPYEVCDDDHCETPLMA